MVVPGPGGRVIAQVERDKRNARLHQPPRKQGLLTPEVLAVAVADRLRLARQVERLLGASADEQFDGVLSVAVHRPDRLRSVKLPPQLVEVSEQRAAVEQPLLRQAAGQREEV